MAHKYDKRFAHGKGSPAYWQQQSKCARIACNRIRRHGVSQILRVSEGDDDILEKYIDNKDIGVYYRLKWEVNMW